MGMSPFGVASRTRRTAMFLHFEVLSLLTSLQSGGKYIEETGGHIFGPSTALGPPTAVLYDEN